MKSGGNLTQDRAAVIPGGSRDTVLVLAGAVITGASSTLMHLSGTSGPTVTFFRSLYALPVLIVLAAREIRRWGRPGWREMALGATAGVFLALDLILWLSSIEAMGAGLATVVQDMQILFVAGGAWLMFGSRPPRRLVLLMPVLLLGIVLISGIVGSSARHTATVRGTFLGVASAVAYAGFLLAIGWRPERRRKHNSTFLASVTVATGGVALAVGVAGTGIRLEPTWPSTGWLIVLALTTQVFGWLVIAAAMFRVSSLHASVALLLQPVSAVFLGWAALAERPTLLQLLGVAVVVASTTLAIESHPAPSERPESPGSAVCDPVA